MDLGLTGKVAIVTGGSTGIGRATVELLAAEGAVVVAASRRPPATPVSGAEHVATDLSAPDAATTLVDEVVRRHGTLDVLVNNAAIALLSGGFADAAPESWDQTLSLNLLAPVRAMQAALPHLEVSKGAIVNVTTVNSRMPTPQGAAYSASKAALLNASKNVAVEYAKKGVRVVVVSPGLTATPMWLGEGGIAEVVAAAMGTDPDTIAASAVGDTPYGRFLEPIEIARCICFAASPVGSALTGAEIVADGGLTPTI
jgi:NAD(P)-dependent dehydrogenase (short-subunit alcohol dehydrogenase family)